MPVFLLPDLGEGLTEAEVVRWLVADGDTVVVDQPVVEVETAKAKQATAAAAAAGLSACTGPSAPAATVSPSGQASGAPSSADVIDAAGVQRGVDALPGIIDRYLQQYGVPGLAIAIVHEGQVRYLEGFGLREVGKPDKPDADTVFQLASVSKPISATVVAAAMTK